MIVLAAAGNAKVFWYLTRGMGVGALILLTASVALGVVTSVRWRSDRWPRFITAGLHRNLTLLAIAFVAVHVLATVADGYTPIGLQDAVIPFISPYRPIWLGLGAIAFDLLLALVATSLLREKIGYRMWRYVHWLAYLSWPVALVHALGTGTDARLGWMRWTGVACVAVVAFAVISRAALTPDAPRPLRGGAALAALVVPLALLVWYQSGPAKHGWARRAGTPTSLLAGRRGRSGSAHSGRGGSKIGRPSELPILVRAYRNAATDEPAGRPRRHRGPRAAARRRRRIGPDRPAGAAARRWRVDDRERRLVRAGRHRNRLPRQRHRPRRLACVRGHGRSRWPTGSSSPSI